jgi:hypothetical protein
VTSTPRWWKFSQKVLDLKWPIREADSVGGPGPFQVGP